jgi:predicted RNase H-like nuclease (RuvC/YqgF family)
MDEDQGVVENQKQEAVAVDNSAVILNMEGMIKSLITTLDKQKEETGALSETLNDIFDNDETYRKHTEDAKAAAKIKSATKAEILKQPQAADLNNKIKTLKSEMKENKASLSDYLREFQRMSGISEIEGEDGELREIVYDARLVRKSSKFGD